MEVVIFNFIFLILLKSQPIENHAWDARNHFQINFLLFDFFPCECLLFRSKNNFEMEAKLKA